MLSQSLPFIPCCRGRHAMRHQPKQHVRTSSYGSVCNASLNAITAFNITPHGVINSMIITAINELIPFRISVHNERACRGYSKSPFDTTWGFTQEPDNAYSPDAILMFRYIAGVTVRTWNNTGYNAISCGHYLKCPKLRGSLSNQAGRTIKTLSN